MSLRIWGSGAWGIQGFEIRVWGPGISVEIVWGT